MTTQFLLPVNYDHPVIFLKTQQLPMNQIEIFHDFMIPLRSWLRLFLVRKERTLITTITFPTIVINEMDDNKVPVLDETEKNKR